LFSTVSYARQIVFAPKEGAERAIDKITSIHKAVESARGDVIPDWAYRDVLFMLIHYSIAAYELLERKLSDTEKEAAYEVFLRIGRRMYLKELPATYQYWLPVREEHMKNDLERSKYTDDLFLQYKKHLGKTRFKILIEAQILVIPYRVRKLLGFKSYSLLRPTVPLYKLSRLVKLDSVIKYLLLPKEYHKQIKALDRYPEPSDSG
jgi:hypothetical protein